MQRAAVDLLIIGADAAGLAAAACAAKSGASVALAPTGGEAPALGATAEPPNFVWRMLDLHLHDLGPAPGAPQTTLLEKGALSTTADPMRTGDALAARDPALEHLWPAFAAEMKRGAAGRAPDSTERFLSANALLNDFFADEDLKTHLISAFVAPFGLAGDEIGSALALAGAGDAARARISASALYAALEDVALKAGVERLSGRLQTLARADGKFWKAVMDNGHDVRGRKAMASSVLLGEAAGLCVSCNGSPLVRRIGAEAIVRIRCDKRPSAAALRAPGDFFTATDRAAILRARDAMIDGRLADEPVLRFSVSGKEIIARAPFVPARLRENGETRDWTGQDKQILGRQAAALIEKRLGGGLGAVREIEVTIGADAATGLTRRAFDIPAIPAPPPSHDPVGAAAALALEIVRDE
ncbi:MAG: hypothetical protein A3E78_12670 [Alphaproteobacteria bacterium RIFCSPHIGHO2_12_FULL_63_12]|nr:MAG: hypothetical protein A3E78_12670 [Alphaproteobacteria bacterium RIFCSPHIGHO2_12_FULL_63_12]